MLPILFEYDKSSQHGVFFCAKVTSGFISIHFHLHYCKVINVIRALLSFSTMCIHWKHAHCKLVRWWNITKYNAEDPSGKNNMNFSFFSTFSSEPSKITVKNWTYQNLQVLWMFELPAYPTWKNLFSRRQCFSAEPVLQFYLIKNSTAYYFLQIKECVEWQIQEAFIQLDTLYLIGSQF